MKGDFSEIGRKSLHVAMGFFALLLAFLTWRQALVLAVVALLHNWFVLPLYGRKRFFRDEANKAGRDIGILLYPASIAVLIVVFRNHLEIVAAAWGLLAFGDGFATIIGKLVGGLRLPWNSEKSWSGFVAFVVFGFMAARFLYVWTFIGQMASVGGDWSVSGANRYICDFLRTSPPLVDPPHSLQQFAGSTVTQLALFSTWFGWSLAFVAIVAAVTLTAALVESLQIGVDDNVSVPFVSAGLLFALSLIDGEVWRNNSSWVFAHLPYAILVNASLAVAAAAARTVSTSGMVGGILMGTALYAFGGWRAFMMLVVFFVLGSVTTRIGYARKAALGIAQEKGGRRGAKNAVANCGVGAILAFVAATSPYSALAMLGLVAAFATAANDTVSSEIGQAYGRRTFLITTFRPVPPGTEGAVSLEGTLAGIAAGGVVAAAALLLGLVTLAGAALVVLAAFFGGTLESYMGAVWERAKLIDNEAINFANTLAGALFAMGLASILPSALLLVHR